MAPSPERWQAALRITVACLICTIPIEAFHLKQPAMMMIGMFMVTRNDSSTTLFGTLLAMGGGIVTCGLLLIYYMVALDLTWLRVLCVPVFIGLGLLMIRVLTPSILGLGVAICIGFGLTLPDTISNVEYLNRAPFYYCWAWILGLSVNLGVQYLMNPTTSHSLLVRGLITRLQAVETLLRRLAAGEKMESSRSSFAAYAFNGAAEQLRLLKIAGVIESVLRKREAEITAQIILVDRLVTAASVLEASRLTPADEALEKRLLRLAEVCAAWRAAVGKHNVPEIPFPPLDRQISPGGHDALPALAEMERVAALLPLAATGNVLPDELRLPPKKKIGFFALVPDAWSNPEHLQFAIKGALASTICYLVYTLFAYPGIYTCVITVILCSLSTVGASVQKGVLRFAGAVVGGTLGFISLMFIFPNLDSLGGFWVPFGAAMALAAYVNFGSVRISYVGVQICLAFSKCALQTYGTYTEVKVARDRMIGIAFGLLVFGVINSRLWPVSALATMRTKLSDVFRQLARLTSLPDKGKTSGPQLAEAYNLRLKIYQDFSVVDEMQEGSKFESGARLRQKLEGMGEDAKSLFLRILAVIQHRPDLRPEAVPGPLRAASLRFRTMLADALENLSDRVLGKPGRAWPDLEGAVAELQN
ncbi:MAG TPA: FUSC family protein, partial [Candidatus Acidoferrales bacterium]|nr:FUSC family protein [Candidatus Acidoferrales bacterium]